MQLQRFWFCTLFGQSLADSLLYFSLIHQWNSFTVATCFVHCWSNFCKIIWYIYITAKFKLFSQKSNIYGWYHLVWMLERILLQNLLGFKHALLWFQGIIFGFCWFGQQMEINLPFVFLGWTSNSLLILIKMYN